MRRHGLVGILSLSLVLAACGQSNLSSSPEQTTSAQGSHEFVEGELLLQLNAGLTAQSLSALETRLGVQAVERLAVTDGAPLYLARITNGRSVQQALADINASGSVRFAEPNWIYTHAATSNDPYYVDGTLWGMYGDTTSPKNEFGSQAGEAWANNRTGSKSVYIGVIDEGIDFNHPDLSANIWVNPHDPADGVDNDGNGYVDDVRGWDFANGNNTIYDGNRKEGTDEHGTHVAGTIGGVGGNGVGVAGVNWNVTMISGKFLGSRGGTTANAIKAVDYFTDLKKRHGLNIVATSNSWGGGGFSQALLDAINRGGNAGILFIAAAGNGGSDGVGDNNDTTANYPSNYECTANGSYDCVVAVAAIAKDGSLARFSNYGAKTVDLGAPGVAVMSTLPGNTYGSYNGTSMATPHVSGGAALYASTHAGASATQIRQAIMDAAQATPTASLQNKTVTNGRLNVGAF
ncbi:S8 family peptidase [Deinococcus peraridilitoris]|uniref:Subtilisin-like serine protease n=1 Tax=Deinococcus peraridilitoris (strain DSM 19664 / LMG 22246 / CIP 109416 / KR-200) TaxID=937777 RepID=L0A5H4_DEIPD|nr:S8 family peptidase [Deinococcus peraridilitoris]AFZ68275.1 subtilisin-like serine protease [Deinococcus peraridilitoris DSM 19664]